jgi:hypothetical protein
MSVIRSSSHDNSKYAVTADHGNAYWKACDGISVSPLAGCPWGVGHPHHPDAEFPRRIYAALRAAHELTLRELLDRLAGHIPRREGKTDKMVLQNYLRELNKQGIATMTDKGTA